MAKMNLKLMNALRATLNRVATLHPDGVLKGVWVEFFPNKGFYYCSKTIAAKVAAIIMFGYRNV